MRITKKLFGGNLNDDGFVHYICQHEVVKPVSFCTPCRKTFIASARYRSHVLNDLCGKGSDFSQKLTNSGEILQKLLIVYRRYSKDVWYYRKNIEQQLTDVFGDTFFITVNRKNAWCKLLFFTDQPALRSMPDLASDGCRQEKTAKKKSSYKVQLIDSIDEMDTIKFPTSELEKLAVGQIKMKELTFSGSNRSLSSKLWTQ